jgi:hypothetical protein
MLPLSAGPRRASRARTLIVPLHDTRRVSARREMHRACWTLDYPVPTFAHRRCLSMRQGRRVALPSLTQPSCSWSGHIPPIIVVRSSVLAFPLAHSTTRPTIQSVDPRNRRPNLLSYLCTPSFSRKLNPSSRSSQLKRTKVRSSPCRTRFSQTPSIAIERRWEETEEPRQPRDCTPSGSYDNHLALIPLDAERHFLGVSAAVHRLFARVAGRLFPGDGLATCARSGPARRARSL